LGDVFVEVDPEQWNFLSLAPPKKLHCRVARFILVYRNFPSASPLPWMLLAEWAPTFEGRYATPEELGRRLASAS